MGEAKDRAEDDQWDELVGESAEIMAAADRAAVKRYIPAGDGPLGQEQKARAREYAWRLAVLTAIRSIAADVSSAIDEASEDARVAREALEELAEAHEARPPAKTPKRDGGLSLVSPKPPI